MSNPNPKPGTAAVSSAPAPVSVHGPIVPAAPVRHALGGIKEQMVQASTVPAVDFKAVLNDLPGNPFLYQRRVAQNILPANAMISVTPTLVNTLAGNPENTNVASDIKDITTTEGSQ